MDGKKTFSVVLFTIGLSLSVLASKNINDGARDGDLEAIKSILIKEPEKLNALDRYKCTPLAWAATRGQWETVRWLLEAGADVRNIGWDGGTVLHRACHYDNPEIVSLLLEKGADLMCQNQWGRAAIHVVARRNCLKTVVLLIARGADLLAVTNEGWTPLHVAAKSGHRDMMKLLIDAGAPEDVEDKDGKVPEEYMFHRPKAIDMNPERYGEYLGDYSTDEGFHVRVWMREGRIYITDFGFDEMYPVGRDDFYCVHEPWSVKFFRDESGAIIELELSFLRRSHRLRKRSSKKLP